jgi:hypothetical protein
LINPDGASAAETGASADGGPLLVDLGSIDTESVDLAGVDLGLVLLDAGQNGLDAGSDLGPDAGPSDSPVVVDASGIDASANCIQRIIDQGYTSGTVPACSACHDNAVSLSNECQSMISCLETSGPCYGASEDCHIACKNSVGGSSVLDDCVTALVADACHE